eukprot:gnl/TRDRNA2_/TRDRNA2_43437_c0_seq1.p1 gnl/TRDRNA2_/TRDRNA2_43437_c0~~gnl/TRDRNA2_/TRDRNA2_43437_c0_seq1.p1  ORF type:complete len:562 (-),score=94.96 gnl/TRDRNA2_/TRDRNA2_43437_c0_seq1:48-1733(-)
MAWLLVFCIAVSVAGDNTLILKPHAGRTGDPVVWVLLPGAEIVKDAYEPLGRAVQNESSLPLWVAVLGTSITPTPVPGEIGPRIDYVLTEMKAHGLNLDKVKLFYGGHSLGTVFIQEHLFTHHGDRGPLNGHVEVVGQVLMGGFIQRKYMYPSWTYPVTTLTIGGELDGLARPTRIAEAIYMARGKEEFPVAIIRGMTHMQFASGAPPKLVQLRDLEPEISYDAAHMAVAKLVAPYFEKVIGIGSATAQEKLDPLLADTADFAKPIIAAFELEGSRHFNAPKQIGGPGASKCKKGGCPSSSAWALTAQEVISSVDGWTLNVSNEYVDCSSTPLTGGEFHLPEISNNTKDATISITTYAQGHWDDAKPSWFDWKEIFDDFDTGFIATSAEEIGVKLASRQCTLIFGAGQANTSFNVDNPNFCMQTNQKAYNYALQNAGSSTIARFFKYGQKYTFGDDVPKQGGPLFLDARLEFEELTRVGGEKVIQVSSPMQKTEVDYWKKHFGPIPRPSFVPDPGCFHYCKLLSPARAMEWIYTDSLRLKRSLHSPTLDASSAHASAIMLI